MEDICLGTGTYRPFLKHITTELEFLESFELVNLIENEGDPICFVAPGRPRMGMVETNNGPHEIHRTGADVRKSLEYQAQEGPMSSSSAQINWRSARRDKFGPPSQ